MKTVKLIIIGFGIIGRGFCEVFSGKKKFIEEGGKEDEYVAEQDPYEKDIKDLLKEFRHLRIEFNKKLEVEKEDNLKLKYQVIEDIKGLINNEESINKTFKPDCAKLFPK